VKKLSIYLMRQMILRNVLMLILAVGLLAGFGTPLAFGQEVVLIDRGVPGHVPGANADELASYLSGLVLLDNLLISVIRNVDPDFDAPAFSENWQTNHPNLSLAALAWIDWSADISNELTVNVYAIDSDQRMSRTLSLQNGSVAGATTISAIMAGMIRQRASEPVVIGALVATQPENTADEKMLEPVPPEPVKEPSKAAFGAYGQVALYPTTNTVLYGMFCDFAYFPTPALAFHIGAGYLTDPNLNDPRYDMTYHQVPIETGARYYVLLSDHEIMVDFGLLADVTYFAFSDTYQRLPSRTVTRVNVGLTGGMGYLYYPVSFMGIGAQVDLAVSLRSQNYWGEERRLFYTGPFSIRFLFGLSFDILR